MSIKAFQTLVEIKADAEGNAPKTIELLRTGSWNTPWHGEFDITPEDIVQFIVNADKGIGLIEADPRIPINYGHDAGGKAAGWIPKLYASDDGNALLGDPDWTPTAKKEIKDGEWVAISPEFNPRSYQWENPEQEYDFAPNVLTGAALTNIPLFKKLKPIMASRLGEARLPSKKVKAAATGDSDKQNEGDHMTLEEIRAKEVADLTAEEKTFLEENKADLTAEELTKYEITAEEPAPAEEEPTDDPVPATDPAPTPAGDPVEASAKGNVTISASELAGLKASAARADALAAEIDREKATNLIAASIKAGQIKSGEKDKAIELVLASRGEQRTKLEAFIAGLPVNASLGKEEGDTGAEAVMDAQKEVDTRTRKVMADARGEGKTIAYSAARKQVLDADENLNAQLKEEQ